MNTWAAAVVVLLPSIVISWVTSRILRPLAHGSGNVGELPPAPLLIGVGRVHDVRVEAHAAGDGEVAVGALDCDPAQVDLARRPLEEDLHGLVHLRRDIEVAREQVARALRDDAQHRRRAGDRVDDLEHRPVAADRDRDIDLVLDGLRRPLAELRLW
jgi:hypothetical protein